MITFFLTLILVLSVWSFFLEPRWLNLRKVTVRLRKPLPRPVTVLHLSDSHFPLHLGTLKRFFKKIAGLETDFVVVTGDIIDNDEGIDHCAEAIRLLKPRLGKFAVFGNHDHYNYSSKEILRFLWGTEAHPEKRNDVEKLQSKLEDAGCRVLRNENVTVKLGNTSIEIIGLDDPVTKKARPEEAFQNLNGAAFRLLLTHSIDILGRLQDPPHIDLALGGHTHGGQVSIPFFGPPPMRRHSRMGRKYVAGLNRYKEIQTYTSRGVSEGKFLPFRFLCRPEAVFFEIR